MAFELDFRPKESRLIKFDTDASWASGVLIGSSSLSKETVSGSPQEWLSLSMGLNEIFSTMFVWEAKS